MFPPAPLLLAKDNAGAELKGGGCPPSGRVFFFVLKGEKIPEENVQVRK